MKRFLFHNFIYNICINSFYFNFFIILYVINKRIKNTGVRYTTWIFSRLDYLHPSQDSQFYLST